MQVLSSDGFWPRSFHSFFLAVREDWAANPSDAKARIVLVTFRLTQFCMRRRERPAIISFPVIVVYRFLTEWLLGLELRPKTRVGPGLALFHGYGLVVNNRSILGANVSLRHLVTIGEAKSGGPCPKIGDGVEFGAGAMVLGGVTVGPGAFIAAGAVITHDVPENSYAR